MEARRKFSLMIFDGSWKSGQGAYATEQLAGKAAEKISQGDKNVEVVDETGKVVRRYINGRRTM